MIVQVSRMRGGMRRITHIEEIVGMEGDIITSHTLFSYEFQGEGKDCLLLGSFKSSGLRPHFAPNAAYFSLAKPLLEALGRGTIFPYNSGLFPSNRSWPGYP